MGNEARSCRGHLARTPRPPLQPRRKWEAKWPRPCLPQWAPRWPTNGVGFTRTWTIRPNSSWRACHSFPLRPASTPEPRHIILPWLMRNIVFQALAEAARSSEPVALGIISGAKGSSPQKVGAKALFYADGRIKGTLGGGCLEAEIQHQAVQSLRTGQGGTFDLLLDHDFGWDDGLMCGGKVCGLILPNAQKAGEPFWSELSKSKRTIVWGVESDYSIAEVA